MKYWYWFIQTVLLYPVGWTFLHIFYRLDVVGSEQLKGIKGSVIIASNHKTLFDSFLVGMALPWGSRLFPLRYMTEEIRFNGPVLEFLRKLRILQVIYRIAGGFPSHRGQGAERAIQLPEKLLKKRETVVMFPEGHLVREKTLGVFYAGASALALKSNATIVPLAILLEPRRIFLNLGKPFKLANPHPITVEAGTQILRQKIESLCQLDASNTSTVFN